MIRYVHGSEDSLDLDVFYIVDKLPSFKECKEFCSDKEENRNIIAVENGVVVDCFKGTVDEINNGLIDTYKLHPQNESLVLTKTVERDVLLKMVRIVRCLISHCSRTQYRTKVKGALKSSSWNERIRILKSIDFTKITDFGKSGSKEDIYKVFAFQLGQGLGLLEGLEFYTKSSVAKNYSQLTKYLYRETDVDTKDLIYFINLFIDEISKMDIIETEEYVYFKDYDKKIDLKREVYL